VDAELRWLLIRAFGPAGAPDVQQPIDGRRALDLGGRLDLLARIGARTAATGLAGEIGQDAADRVRAAYQSIAALAVQSQGLCRQLAEAAADLDIQVVFLKGMALQVTGRVGLGSRGSCDVDVLVPADAAGPFREGLLSRGYSDSGMPASVHQLAAVNHPAGVMVEIHTMVWGVRLGGGGRSAAIGDLMDAGLCEPVAELGEGCWVPVADVLMSHVLVHGIAQHGLAPAAYPMTRMLADVQDLAFGGDEWQRYLDGRLRWIASDVGVEEAGAVRELERRLAAGEDPAGIARDDSNASRLLRHLVAGVLDDGYRQALKVRGIADPQREGGGAATFVRAVGKAVWLTDAQIDAVYGRPGSRLGYLGRRLWRPVDLVVRAVRYGWSWVRFRARRRTGSTRSDGSR